MVQGKFLESFNKKKGATMKYIFFFLAFSTAILGQTDLQFSSLQGFEDSNGKTHLFYKKYTYGITNDLFSLNLDTNIEQKISDSFYISENGTLVYYGVLRALFLGYNNNTGHIDFIQTYKNSVDSTYQIITTINDSTYTFAIKDYKFLEIYPSDDNSHIIVPISNMIDSEIYGIVRSFDKGRTWEIDTSYNSNFFAQGVNPHNMDMIFGVNSKYEIGKSLDGGKTFSIVNTTDNIDKFSFDIDGIHIYGSYRNNIFVSDKSGDSLSWSLFRHFDGYDLGDISIDYSQSGLSYHSNSSDNKIWVSKDFGQSYEVFGTTPRTLMGGIYNKSGSNICYAATKNEIYELTDSSSKVIKRLPVTSLDYYQLAVGNKWIYKVNQGDGVFNNSWKTTAEVKYDSLMENNKRYFYVSRGGGLFFESAWERIDSTGFVYKYSEDAEGGEYVIEDLAISLYYWGDTLFIENENRYKYCLETGTSEYVGESRAFKSIHVKDNRFLNYSYQLVYGIGLASETEHYDFGTTSANLLGAVINGTVYGDTTTVGVEPVENPISYSLHQNYPNPFNPSTTITYSIPKGANVQITVFNLLGEQIETLVNKYQSAGNYKVEFSGKNISNGVYFYKLKAENYSSVKKMILLK